VLAQKKNPWIYMLLSYWFTGPPTPGLPPLRARIPPRLDKIDLDDVGAGLGSGRVLPARDIVEDRIEPWGYLEGGPLYTIVINGHVGPLFIRGKIQWEPGVTLGSPRKKWSDMGGSYLQPHATKNYRSCKHFGEFLDSKGG